jgi:DNA-directed RNA polymerase subunit RPC12/RpoP
MMIKEFEEKLLERVDEEKEFKCTQCGTPAERVYSYYGESWRCRRCGFRWWIDRAGRWLRPIKEEILL